MQDEDDDLARQVEKFREAIISFGEILPEVLMPQIKAAIEVARGIYSMTWQTYRDIGMPYGETDDGFMRWLMEIGEANRLEQQARQIRERHALLVDFRRQLAEIVDRREQSQAE